MASTNGDAAGPPDRQVIEHVLEGARDDFEVLVQRYQERFYRFAFGILGDADAASDVVQDSFVKAYTSLRSCQNPSQFGAWALQIVRNRCRDHLKSPKQQRSSIENHQLSSSDATGPAEVLEQVELRELLSEALAALPVDHREAFLLKHLHGYTYDEMSEMLGASLSALKMRVHRARETLRACLGERRAIDDVTFQFAGSSLRKADTIATRPSRHAE